MSFATSTATQLLAFLPHSTPKVLANLTFNPYLSNENMSTSPTKNLETFPNPRPGRAYEIAFECPEFTCVCPMTGQPDFATIRIRYTPNERCVELKSLKLYLWSYREEGHFHEAVTNQILDDLVAALDPLEIKVTGDFWVRGGIHTVVETGHVRTSPRAPQTQT